MNNHWITYALAASCVAVIFFGGCIPEDSLQWSDDGSVGVLAVGGALYSVDGQTGDLTEITPRSVQLLPDISKDGKWIAYAQQIESNSLSEGLKLLPAGQVKMITYYAGQVRNEVLETGGLKDDEFPFPDVGPLTPHDYRNWAIRYLCENADSELAKVLGNEGIEKGKNKPINYFQVVVAPAKNPSGKRIVTASVFSILAPQLSPDAKSVAYLMHTQQGQVSNAYEEFALCVASLEADIRAMLVDSRVAFGYDWRDDGKAIAYLSADSENLPNEDLILGTLKKKVVADSDGGLLAEPVQVPDSGSACTHRCTGKDVQLVGTLFYPWLKVEYGLDGRIFFSSFALPLPASKRDEATCSLFCYDPLTATVTDVLPRNVSVHTSDQVIGVSLFSLSPNGREVLLPIKNNRFVVHALGTDSVELPIPQEEGFGDDELPEMSPCWKGNNEISFLVAENSHFVPKAEQGAAASRKEIIVLNKTAGTSRVLSKSWPDGMEPGSKDRQ